MTLSFWQSLNIFDENEALQCIIMSCTRNDIMHMLNNTNTKGFQDIYPGTFVLLHLSHTL